MGGFSAANENSSLQAIGGLPATNDLSKQSGQVFHTQQNLLQHPAASHPPQEQQQVWCSRCGNTFMNAESMAGHECSLQRTADQRYCCRICSETFTHQARYHRHMASHQEPAPSFSCRLCPMTFTLRRQLTRHLRTHDQLLPFTCEQCGATFPYKESLIRHYQIHTGVRRHKCMHCPKAFLQKCHLVEHQRIHTGERPFSCNVCKKRFVQRSHMVVHRRGHYQSK